MKRGIISSPPQHLLEWSNHAGVDGIESTSYWIRSKAGPEFALPRLFSPYYAEAKVRHSALYCYNVPLSSAAVLGLPQSCAERLEIAAAF